MTSKIQDLDVNESNNLVPLFPSNSWNLTQADAGDQTKPTFNWIQAFFDPTFSGVPFLLVWSGNYADDNTPIVSPVPFAYSGESKIFKGKVLYATGKDRFGNTLTATVIGASPTTQITSVFAYGAYN